MDTKGITMRLPFELIDKLEDISKKTRLTKREIVGKWLSGTIIDEERKEFITSVSSGDNFDDLKK